MTNPVSTTSATPATPTDATQQTQLPSLEQMAADLRAMMLKAAQGASSSEKPTAGATQGDGSQ